MLVRYIIKTSMFFYKTLRKGITLRSNSKKYLSYAKPIILIISLLNFINFPYVAVADENFQSEVNEIKNIKVGNPIQSGILDDVEIEFLDPSVLPDLENPNVFNIRGIILDREDKPIEGASVVARSSDDITPKEIITGSDGRFVFESLEKGCWEILVEAEGYAHITTWECMIEIPQIRDSDIKLILDHPVEMRGKVISGVEQPVSNAKVIVAREWTADGKRIIQGHLSQDIFTTITNEIGEFSFNKLKPGKVSIVVEHPDYAPFLNSFVSDAKDVLIKLDHGGAIMGRILDGDNPVKNIEVEIRGQKLSHRHFGYAKSKTDENGNFIAPNLPYFPDIPSGWFYTISIKAQGIEFPLYQIYLTKDQPVREVLLQPSDMAKVKDPKAQYKIVELGPTRKYSPPDRPKGTASIKGKVIPKIRDSAEGLVAHLSYYPLPTKENWFYLETPVENNGNFDFSELPEGEYKLRVEPDIHLQIQTEEWGLFPPVKVKLKRGKVKTLTFTQDDGILRGTIKGLNPELYYSVVLKTDDPKNPWFRMMSHITSSSVKGDGTYEIKTLSPGKYLAILEFWTDSKTTPSGDNLYYSGGMEMFEFQSDGKSVIQKDFDAHFYKVTGKVIDADTKEPVEGLKLKLIKEHPELMTNLDVLSGKDGTFVFPFVPKGDLKFKIVSKDNYLYQILPCSVVNKDYDFGTIEMKKSLAGIMIEAKNTDLADKLFYSRAYSSELSFGKFGYGDILWGDFRDKGKAVFKPLYPGHYTIICNNHRSSVFDDEDMYALKILENVEVQPDKVTRLRLSFEKGILTKLSAFSKSQKSYVPFSEQFWLKNDKGQVLRIGIITNTSIWEVNLKPGNYQFGFDEHNTIKKSVTFSVDESSKGKIVILEIP